MSKSPGFPAAQLNIIQPVPGDDLSAATRLAASIFGTMLFPHPEHDLDKRVAASYTLALRKRMLSGLEPGPSSEIWTTQRIATRGEMLQLFKFLELSSWEEAKSQWERGLVVGEILSLIVWMNINEPGRASLSRGIFLAEEIYRYPGPGSAHARRLSEKTLKRYWAKFWMVGHLWAAFAEICRWHQRAAAQSPGEPSPDGANLAFDLFMDDPGPLIAIATNYLRCITTHIPPNKKPKEPIIHWSRAWLPPEGSIPKDQPDFFDPAKLYCGLSERAAGVLANYVHE